MFNVGSDLDDDFEERVEGPQPIGEVLAEFLSQYEARFPEVHIAIVETPVAAA